MSDLAKRLAFNRYLSRHLTEMSRLLNREVRREDLLTLEESEALLAQANAIQRVPGWKREVPFKEKEQPEFQGLVARLAGQSTAGVYIWTPLAKHCGLPRKVLLSEIAWDFPFDLNPEGILEVLSDDLADRMLLDYWRDDDDRETEMLTIELDGSRWGGVEYPAPGSGFVH